MSMLSSLTRVSQRVMKANVEVWVDAMEDMGRDAIIGMLGGSGTPIGAAIAGFLDYNERISRALGRDIESRFAAEDKANDPREIAKKRRERARYRREHAEWMAANRWRFDWRSQPRVPAGSEAGGEWTEGRLDYPVQLFPNPVSRKDRRRRIASVKAFKARQRAAGNMNTRTIRSQWGDF